MIRTVPLRLFLQLSQIGSTPDDSTEDRLQKTILVMGSLMVLAATAIWGSVYYYFSEPVPAAIAYFYFTFTLLGLVYVAITKRYRFFRFGQLLLGLVLPFLQMLALGGFGGSGGVVLWALISPLGALLLVGPKEARRWTIAFLALLIVTGFLHTRLTAGNNIPVGFLVSLYVLNVGTVSAIALTLLIYFIQEKNQAYHLLHIEEQKAENLLLNILPKEIAAILKNESRTIADQFDGASILFADLVGFTSLTAKLPPVQMVDLLNEIFSYFDSLVEKHDLEKIRTIGDNYMVAAGVPRPRSDHAQILARLALEMEEYLRDRPDNGGPKIEFRIGLNSGPVVGGVIGRKKFVYDVWGDAVNIASRMESEGVPGRIQITPATHELIKRDFECVPRGRIPVKGKGEMETWFLVGARN